MNTDPLTILFVSPECAPFAKAGGLGDVVGALPEALQAAGHTCRILLPLYQRIDREKFGLVPDGCACIHMGEDIEHWVGVWSGKTPTGVQVWFLDYEDYFNRPGIYHASTGSYDDNAFRFALLSKAALQLCIDRNFIPNIIHSHDWASALTAAFLRYLSPQQEALMHTASVLTIHNMGYQGKFDAKAFPYFGLPSNLFTPDIFEDYGRVNLLKAGLYFADALTTVAPAYAQELLTDLGGQGLAPYLQRRSNQLVGILNGADYNDWNPAIDQHIPATYTPADLTGKAICKQALQQKFKLEERSERPLLGIVSRLARQKGFNLLKPILRDLLQQMDAQFVLLGDGTYALQDFFLELQSSLPGSVGVHIGFSIELSHLIEAGSDFFLMPSLYEPCGLNQIYSMKYGTIPIVRDTGGLTDTVSAFDPATGQGTGFLFEAPTSEACSQAIQEALATWNEYPQQIAQLQQNGMRQNFDWAGSARNYVHVYRKALTAHRSPLRSV